MPLFQIDLKDVTKKYKNKVILDKINLVMDNTKYNIIKGYNGSGKSTLVKCLITGSPNGLHLNTKLVMFLKKYIYLIL